MSSIAQATLPGRILVAIDGSELSYKALTYSLMMASLMKSKVTVISVIVLPSYASQEILERLRQDLSDAANVVLKKAASMALDGGTAVDTKLVETRSSVVKAITDTASELGADLIAVGTRGTTQGVPRLMLGSVAAGVVSFASCPVIAVR